MQVIRVKVFPDSKHEHIVETAPRVIRLYVREPAQHNLANNAVLRALSAFYTIPKNKLHMISGHQKHNKLIEIRE